MVCYSAPITVAAVEQILMQASWCFWNLHSSACLSLQHLPLLVPEIIKVQRKPNTVISGDYYTVVQYFCLSYSGITYLSERTTVVSYINMQNKTPSLTIFKLSYLPLTQSSLHLLSPLAANVLGHLNLRADFISRDGCLVTEWWLHPQGVKQIWDMGWDGLADWSLLIQRKHALPTIFLSDG